MTALLLAAVLAVVPPTPLPTQAPQGKPDFHCWKVDVEAVRVPETMVCCAAWRGDATGGGWQVIDCN